MSLTTLCITWALLGFLAARQVESINSSADKISRSNADFANTFYLELVKQNDSRNLFFSPFSIHSILALAYVSARGKTAQELSAGLRLPVNVDVVKTGFQHLLQGMNHKTKNVKLEIANKIYLATRFRVKDEFNKVATQNFLSEIENVDFGSGEETAQIINKWVGNKTHHKIDGVITKGELSTRTMLMIVNAVYFKGTWEIPFEEHGTYSKPFFITTNQKKMVYMMNVQDNFILVKNNEIGADILELNYKDNSFSLVLILPFQVDGLSKVENKLQGAKLKTILESVTSRHKKLVKVFLPKFKLENENELKKYLQDLGMISMFTNSADFSAMSESSVHIERVLHKALVEVTELGTEAAAVVEVEGEDESDIEFVDEPKVFKADHPFLFIVRSRQSSAILFMGRFALPE